MMKIKNNTSICTELIKALSLTVGIDLTEKSTLEIDYSCPIKGDHSRLPWGSAGYRRDKAGRIIYMISILPHSTTAILVHELRHVYQFQALTPEVCSELYISEDDMHGYKGNIFEIDAEQYEAQWLK